MAFNSCHGFDTVGDNEEDHRIITSDLFENSDHEQVYSAIRLATEDLPLLEQAVTPEGPLRCHITRVDLIRQKRGAFRWLPVYYSNDIEHGSWWFVYGSLMATITAVLPLLKDFIHELDPSDDTLPAMSFYGTWIMLAVSGFFNTLGSYAFVRAFREPAMKPWFSCKILATDELVGAWLFLLGTLPGIPFSLMYWTVDPENMTYFLMVIASITFVICSLLFVIACYPSPVKETKQYIKPMVRWCCGRSHWTIKHLQNDWLATTWLFFWATFFCLIGSIGYYWEAHEAGNGLEQIVYGLSVLDTFLFLLGSMYFIAGSYPPDILSCYKPTFKKSSVDGGAFAITFDSFDH